MKKLFITILIISIFTGCQSALNVFEKTGGKYEQGLQHTKVKSLVKDNETQAILNITYLNSVDTKWNDKYQNFLVGIYISNDNEAEDKQYLNNPNYTISMNKKNYEKVILLTKKHSLYKYIPLKNPWAKYYILSFNNIEEDKLIIKYATENNTSVELSFIKE